MNEKEYGHWLKNYMEQQAAELRERHPFIGYVVDDETEDELYDDHEFEETEVE